MRRRKSDEIQALATSKALRVRAPWTASLQVRLGHQPISKPWHDQGRFLGPQLASAAAWSQIGKAHSGEHVVIDGRG
jgi:hypothetical protein